MKYWSFFCSRNPKAASMAQPHRQAEAAAGYVYSGWWAQVLIFKWIEQ